MGSGGSKSRKDNQGSPQNSTLSTRPKIESIPPKPQEDEIGQKPPLIEKLKPVPSTDNAESKTKLMNVPPCIDSPVQNEKEKLDLSWEEEMNDIDHTVMDEDIERHQRDQKNIERIISAKVHIEIMKRILKQN